MPTYFFDTSALQHRYIAGPFSRRIRRIISDKSNECYIAEVTVLEIASALANRCRQGEFRHGRYDQADNRFWTDIANELIKPRSTGNREIMRARNLIRYAQLLKRRKLTSADALIAVCALELALERKERVIFYTSDWNLFDILRQIDAYAAALLLQLAGKPKVPLSR